MRLIFRHEQNEDGKHIWSRRGSIEQTRPNRTILRSQCSAASGTTNVVSAFAMAAPYKATRSPCAAFERREPVYHYKAMPGHITITATRRRMQRWRKRTVYRYVKSFTCRVVSPHNKPLCPKYALRPYSGSRLLQSYN